MAPQEEGTTSSTDETSGQEQQAQQQQATPKAGETPQGEQQQEATATKETRLPDDHPLVKAYRAQLEENRKLAGAKTEAAEANAKAAKVTKLEEELAARPTQEALDTLQTRYDRLEAFAQAVGLGKALDSRTFTRSLFETDTDVKDLVKEWNRLNPTATSTALGSAAGGEGPKKHNPNDLLRIAAGKK
jgi:hypothetical protein